MMNNRLLGATLGMAALLAGDGRGASSGYFGRYAKPHPTKADIKNKAKRKAARKARRRNRK